jgi:hypothetical protein
MEVTWKTEEMGNNTEPSDQAIRERATYLN